MATSKQSIFIPTLNKEDVWNAIADFEMYPEYMPDIDAVEILSSGGNEKTTFWAVRLDGAYFEWTERDTLDFPNTISFDLIEGDVESLSGVWTIEEAEGGHLVSLEMSFDIGIPSLAATLDPIALKALEKNVANMLGGLPALVSKGPKLKKAEPQVVSREIRKSAKSINLASYKAQVGTPIPIEDLPELEDKPDVTRILRERGLDRVSCFASKDAAFAALMRCCSDVLSQSGKKASDIEAVFFTTGNSPWTLEDDRELIRALGTIGLGNAALIGANLSSCANTGIAYRTALGVMCAEELDYALLITLDMVESGARRLSPPDVGMNADGVSACLLSTEQGQFEILESSSFVDSELAIREIASKMPSEYVERHIRGIGKTVSRALDARGLRLKDIHLVLAPNLNSTLIQIIAAAMGVKRSKIMAPNIGTTGHVQTTDALLNLQSVRPVQGPEEGEFWIMLSCSDHAWACTLLKAR
ncbi:type II toxin-antitoxin system RatA family toxin [Erythrobacter sp.]|uniref:type II toxin-antitoxin system RatA family toxin n=1 Tax=Erythrobacter sp. TaxID=1042 RepID=UPI003C791922